MSRILMLSENLPVPPDRRILSEAAALRDAGHTVTVVCQAGPDQPLRETREGIRFLRYAAPPTGPGLLGYGREYGVSLLHAFALSLTLASEEGFDVIHAGNPPDLYFLIGGFWKMLGKRFVFDQHDLSPEVYESRFHRRAGIVPRALRLLERASYRLADAVIVTNESYRRIAISRGGVDPSRVVVVRNGPRDGWPPVAEADEGLKRRRRHLALFMGVAGHQDGAEVVVDAAAELRRRGRDDVHFAIVGDGDAVPDLKARAAALQVDDAVEFVGWVSEEAKLATYLMTADVCLSPEPSSPLNDVSTFVKVMEYIAAGRPIVAFDLPETRETAGPAAVYVMPGDNTAYASAIARVLDEPELAESMRREAARRLPGLRWETQQANLLASYALLSGRAQRSAAAEGAGD